MKYLGHLSNRDPLYGYLRNDILPQLDTRSIAPDFRVYRFQASNHVYLYEDQASRTRIIGKFFGAVSDRPPETAFRYMEREFNNLSHLRSIGLAGYPHYIARPLGRNASLNCVLVEEFCYGTPLNDFILGAIREGARESLFEKLTALAYFLAHSPQSDRHQRAGGREPGLRILRPDHGSVEKLGTHRLDEAEEFHRMKERWRERTFMWEDNQVLVHGDVTPTNILFGDGPWVIAIDLERMKPADRVFDLGRVAAEIKHFFMQYTGNKWRAEPFIGHFLWEYACHFPERENAFRSITRRVPFTWGSPFYASPATPGLPLRTAGSCWMRLDKR